jgi:hypothetical protein
VYAHAGRSLHFAAGPKPALTGTRIRPPARRSGPRHRLAYLTGRGYAMLWPTPPARQLSLAKEVDIADLLDCRNQCRKLVVYRHKDRQLTVVSPPWRFAKRRLSPPGRWARASPECSRARVWPSPRSRKTGPLLGWNSDGSEPAQGPSASGRSPAQGTRGHWPWRGGPGRPRRPRRGSRTRRTRCWCGEPARSAWPGAPRVVGGRGLGGPARAGRRRGEGLSLPRMRSGNPSRPGALGRVARADPGAKRAQALAPALLGAARPPGTRNPARPVRAVQPWLLAGRRPGNAAGAEDPPPEAREAPRADRPRGRQ